jgi:pimeloyl-ACP methyl ester carboxylesterase
MALAKINGIELYYEVHGDGPALVFAHGAGGNHLSWWQQVPVLAQSYRCVTFDHRGFGLSREQPGGPGARAFVEDLRALLDHLGIERAALAGQSMGGWTVLGFAVKYPERTRALALCDTTAGMDDASVIAEHRRLREKAQVGLGEIIKQAIGVELERRDPARAFLYRQISALNVGVPPDLLEVLFAARHHPDVVVERHIPAILIVGEEDVLTPPSIMELMRRRLGPARLIRIPGSGHSVYFERPDEFNRTIENFLREALA